jgi:hypothetical protein
LVDREFQIGYLLNGGRNEFMMNHFNGADCIHLIDNYNMYTELLSQLCIDPGNSCIDSIEGNNTLVYMQRVRRLSETLPFLPDHDKFKDVARVNGTLHLRAVLVMKPASAKDFFLLASTFTVSDAMKDPSGRTPYSLSSEKFRRHLD